MELPLCLREKEILDLLCQGKSQREMADSLCLSVKAVKWHLTKIYRKAGMKRMLLIRAIFDNKFYVTKQIDKRSKEFRRNQNPTLI